MTNTAERIQAYLEKHESATVEQISRSLYLSKADIHYHIQLLRKGEKIQICPGSFKKGAGRPARQYSLIRPVSPSTARLVVSLLFEQLSILDQRQQISSEFPQMLADALLQQCPAWENESLSPATRLNQLAQELSGFGFTMVWYASKIGPNISFIREPITQLLPGEDIAQKTLQSMIARIEERIA